MSREDLTFVSSVRSKRDLDFYFVPKVLLSSLSLSLDNDEVQRRPYLSSLHQTSSFQSKNIRVFSLHNALLVRMQIKVKKFAQVSVYLIRNITVYFSDLDPA